MAFIYQTENYSEIVQKDIEGLKKWKKLEDKKNIATYHPFYIFTNKYENYKLIFEKSDIIDNTHIYILREHFYFGKKWDRIKKELKNNIYKETIKEQKEKAKSEFLIKEERLKIKPPFPSSLSWYNDLISEYNFNVYETETWKKAYDEISGQEIDIYRIIKRVLKKEITIHPVDEVKKLFTAALGDLYIILKKRESNIIVLITAGYTNNKNDKEKKIELSKNIDAKITTKAYSISTPANEKDITEGFNFWNKNIQKTSKTSNLALHEEQIIFLKEKYNPPVFINGQAGSGKSTMLYYLTADLIINRWDKKQQENKILFLTENQGLLAESKKQIKLLLENNPNLAFLSKNEIQDNEPEYFSFQNLIHSKLIDADTRKDFKINKFINFNKFKNFYTKGKLPLMKQYSAEIVWYIITTFIEGYYVDKNMTPELFQNLPKKENQNSKIELSDFKNIYSIWQKFYLKLKKDEKYWDRIGLVKKILKEQEEFEILYTFIFCDEVQDFSRVEIQLLVKLSEFLKYDLSNVKEIPVVFAGDPFQTVNPTGFSLNRFKNLLNNELIAKLKLPKREIAYPLQFNYRSSGEIVNIANIIQFYRHKFLLADIDTAQKPIQSFNKENLPLLFSTNKKPVEFEERLDANVVFIVPDYLKSNENNAFKTKNNIDNLDEEKNNWFAEHNNINNLNIKTTVNVKGAEYETIVVYKFGEYFIQNFENKLKDIKESTNDFKLSFFFNKLYVAITRATKKIIILDTNEGIKYFWDFFKNDNFIDTISNSNWFDKIENKKYDIENIAKIGNIKELPKSNIEDALNIAKEDMETGILQQDPDKLRFAVKAYTYHGKNNYATKCKALVFKIERDFEKAGEEFNKIDATKDALECFFIAGSWSKILSINNNKNNYFYYFSNLMQNNIFEISLITEIKSSFKKYINEINWENIFYEKIINVLTKNIDIYTDSKCKEIATELCELNNKIFDEIIAEYFYKIKNYKNAVEYWRKYYDGSKIKESKKYYISEIRYTNKPEDKIYFYGKIIEYWTDKKISTNKPINKLSYIQNIKDNSKKIIEIFEKNKNKIKGEEIEIVFNSYLRLKRFDRAIKYYRKEFDWAVIGTEKKINAFFIREVFEFIAGNNDRTEILNVKLFKHFENVIIENKIQKFLNKKIKKHKTKDEDSLDIVSFLIKLIAYSDLDYNQLSKEYYDLIIKYKSLFLRKNNSINDYYIFIATVERVIENTTFILNTVINSLLKKVRNEAIIFNHLIDRWHKNEMKLWVYQIESGKNTSKSFEKIKGFEDVHISLKEKLNKSFKILANQIKIPYQDVDLERIKKLPEYPLPYVETKKIIEEEKVEENKIKQINNSLFDYLFKKFKDNNDFKFKLREDNLYQKLEHGFWFDGDNNSVELSFWKGLDGKKSNISFIINEDETCDLILSAINSDKIAIFFNKYTKQKGNFSRSKRAGQEINVWKKEYNKDNYLENLEEFLNNDKKDIDLILGFGLDNKFDGQTLDGLRFITDKEFNENLEIIEKYKNETLIIKEKTEEKDSKIKLKSLYLKNIGRFENLELKLNDRITCVLGENGIGKSTILSAIPLAITGVDENTIIDVNNKRLQEKLRIENFDENGKKYCKEGEIILEYETNKKHKNTIKFEDDEIRNVKIYDFGTENDFAATIQNDSNYFKNLILGFPQAQGTNKSSEPKLKEIKRPNIGDLLSLIMYYPEEKLTSFSKWLDIKFKNREKEKKNLEQIENIFQIVSKIISRDDSKAIEFITINYPSGGDKIIIIKTKDNPNGIPLFLLSQGLSNVLMWIGHFMSRLYDTYPDSKNIFDSPAILFIDEIDKYLHPKWQKRILKVLLEVFTNTQFIITTHSPLVLDGLKKGQLAHLKLDATGKPIVEYNETNIWGWEYQDILERYMDKKTIDDYEYNLETAENELETWKKENKSKEEIKEKEDEIIKIKESHDAALGLLDLKKRLKAKDKELEKLIKELKNKK